MRPSPALVDPRLSSFSTSPGTTRVEWIAGSAPARNVARPIRAPTNVITRTSSPNVIQNGGGFAAIACVNHRMPPMLSTMPSAPPSAASTNTSVNC